MKNLIGFELTKMVKKKLVFITFTAFGVIWILMLYSWIFGSEWAAGADGRELYGQEAAAYNREIALRYEGDLTDEKVLAILEEFKPEDGRDVYDMSNNTYAPIARLFAERDGSPNGKTVSEVFPGFDRAPRLGQSTRWESFLYSMMYIVMMAGIVVIVVVSPVFSEEYTSGMDALILTSRYGKNRCPWAKTAASFCFTAVFAVLILGLGFAAFYAGSRFEGWNADIQLSELTVFSNVREPLPCWKAAAAMGAVSLFSLLTVNGLTLLFSVISKTAFQPVILSAVVYIAPMFVTSAEPAIVRIMSLFPINSLNITAVMNSGDWMMIAGIGAVAVLVAVCSSFVGTKVFAAHQAG